MLSSQRFKTWNIVDSALFGSSTGHHYWETKALTDELVRRGETVRIFSHIEVPTSEQFPGTQIFPVFSLFLYGSVSDDRTWGALENFVVHNRTFSHELSSLDPSLFQDSLVLFPTIGENHLLGIFRWLSKFSHGAGPKAAICLLPPQEWSKTNRSANFYRTLWKECPSAIRKEIAFFSRTPQSAAMFAKHSGMPTRVFPYVAPETHFAPKQQPASAARDAMVVSFVGGARRERGGALIAEVVKQCAGLGVQFFIQVRGGDDHHFDTHVLSALSDWPHVRLQEGTLERDDYYGAIADSVVLLAYRPSAYRWRDSGVYAEAKLLDAPVLVSAGTWMADEVGSLGNGLVINDYSAAAIVDCIARAQKSLPELKAAAARVGRIMRKRSGVARCVDAVAGAFASSGALRT